MAFDFLIAGGGTAGCVLASRLSQAGHSVAIFEAGPEDYSEKVMSPLAAPMLHGSSLEYNYITTAQTNLANRKVPNFAGRVLSGSSAVNYGNWTRCHSADYDAWADLVGDERWDYAHLLKYFRKVQHHHDSAADPEVYGFDGPMYTTAGDRYYPLRDPLETALRESGLKYNADANGGSPFGFSLLSENWRDGKRQPASLAYDLSKAKIFTEVVVKRIVFDVSTKVASGIELLDGRVFHASKEVLICCGSIRTPQLLMLSGIGPVDHLSALSIPMVMDLPVGQNLHDHLAVTLYWKLKHPEQGLAIGSPTFMKPGFEKGNPIDWIVTSSITDTSKAAAADKISAVDPLIRERRGHLEFFVSYAPIAAQAFFNYSLLGTHISSPVLGLLPTSRGTIRLSSTDPSADPIIDPNYLDSEIDREALRTGIRLVLRTMLDTPSGQSVIEGETPPPGQPQLTSSSSNKEIDQRAQAVGRSFFQGAGTAAMGTVVDTELRVKNVHKLRVIDASILPIPLAGHYQCKLCYAQRYSYIFNIVLIIHRSDLRDCGSSSRHYSRTSLK
jgi:choline dehydrogenase-like flavoprotein